MKAITLTVERDEGAVGMSPRATRREARGLTTQGRGLRQLQNNVKEAVTCGFGAGGPRFAGLHQAHDPVVKLCRVISMLTTACAVAIAALAEVAASGAQAATEPCNFPWVWAARLRPTNTPCDHTLVQDLAVDTAGNVFVTGPECTIETSTDYRTAKYDRDGKLLWTARYNGPSINDDYPRALALDSFGNCYVTGSSRALDGDNDTLTIKYDSAGGQLWVNRFNRRTDIRSEEQGRALAVDGKGNAYVTGIGVTLKLDPNGQPVWTNNFAGQFISLATNVPSVYIASTVEGGRPSGLGMICTNGSLVWSTSIPSLQGLTTDRFGNAYIIARTNFDFPAGNGDIVLTKYSPTGAVVWTSIYDGPTHRIDTPGFNALTVDSNGNVYVTGSSWSLYRLPIDGSDVDPFDMVTLKYRADGQLLWASTYNGPHNGWDYGTSVAVDAQGSVYVAGESDFPHEAIKPTTQISDAFLVKYDATGRQLWVSRYEGSQRRVNYSFFSRLMLDPAGGNIFATGASPYLFEGGVRLEFLVVKYDQTTPRLSVHGFPSPGVFQGCLVSAAGRRFDIQATTDFGTWQPVTTVTNRDGLVPFLDVGSGAYERRFYRALQIQE